MPGKYCLLPGERLSITVSNSARIDYVHLERSLGPYLEAYRRGFPQTGNWIIWKANGQKLVGRFKACRRSGDYEVRLLRSDKCEHIVVVQSEQIVKINPSHLELLAASV